MEGSETHGEKSAVETRTQSFRYMPEVATVTELWDWWYQEGMAVDSARKAAGIHAIKQALIDNGFAQGIVVDLPAFGASVANRTGDFQAAEGLQRDEVVGRVTARHLFRKYGRAAEDKYTIPDDLVNHLKAWESQNDPVARSYTGDEGIAQINPESHPNVTVAQMWDPAFASNFIGSYLRGSYIYVGADWDGAIAAYNIGGYYARQWVKQGKPATGGPALGTDASGAQIYAWDRATFYSQHAKGSTI